MPARAEWPTFRAGHWINDLDEARVLHAALADIFVAHTGGREDPVALERVEKLCAAAIGAVEDVECRVAIRGVKTYSRLFFCDDGHVGIDSGSLARLSRPPERHRGRALAAAAYAGLSCASAARSSRRCSRTSTMPSRRTSAACACWW